MGDEINAFFAGMIVILFAFLLLWLATGNVLKTNDGQYYIITHGNVYKLASDKPVKIITSLVLHP